MSGSVWPSPGGIASFEVHYIVQGNTVQTDLAGVRYVLAGDRTAVWVDARNPAAFAKGSLPKAVAIRRGEAEAANDDGRLPKKDKGTRVIVFADTPAEARAGRRRNRSQGILEQQLFRWTVCRPERFRLTLKHPSPGPDPAPGLA